MESFTKEIQIRWSDLDPNYHLRHSVYYDWGAYSRIEFFYEHGFNAALMRKHHIGPIIFREECVFRKEIHFEDKITIDLKLVKSRKDSSRWTIQHVIYKNEKTVSAILTIDGAWINTVERKLATPPAEVQAMFNKMPRDNEFLWTDH